MKIGLGIFNDHWRAISQGENVPPEQLRVYATSGARLIYTQRHLLEPFESMHSAPIFQKIEMPIFCASDKIRNAVGVEIDDRGADIVALDVLLVELTEILKEP